MTSRDQRFENLGIVDKVQVTGFSLPEALEFLQARLNRGEFDQTEHASIAALRREMEGLPLALEQMAAFMVEMSEVYNITFAEYLKDFETRGLGQIEKHKPETGDYPNSVATTWLISFDRISQESKSAVDLLKLTGMFRDSHPIPFSFVLDFVSELTPSLQHDLDRACDKNRAIAEALAPLARFSMVTVDKSAQTYEIHRLVQQVVINHFDVA